MSRQRGLSPFRTDISQRGFEPVKDRFPALSVRLENLAAEIEAGLHDGEGLGCHGGLEALCLYEVYQR